jgi:hypothetical protein
MGEPRVSVVKSYPVEHMTRDEYLEYFKRNYKRQHKTSIGPTQRGKTTESIQSLEGVISPEQQTVLLSAKPAHRDAVMNEAAEKLHLKLTEEWPPSNRWLDKKRGYNGYVLRPHQTLTDLKADNANVQKHFRAAMLDCYGSKVPIIIVVDETHKIQNNYKLKDEYEAPLMSGQPDVAEWSNIQRGRYVSQLAYDSPEWILFFQEPDRANTRRYAEMVGGVNRDQVADIVENLETKEISNGQTISQFLLVRRSGPRLIIVDY